MLSTPFAADAPRGSITMTLANTGGSYSGSGSATIPFCRTPPGNVLTTSQTYGLEALRATEQQLVNGQWMATTLEGTVTTGAATVAGDGTTCTANETRTPVILRLIAPEQGPAPLLADARFEGVYDSVPAAANALTAVPACELGACAVTMTYDLALGTGAAVSTVATLDFKGGAYGGQGTSKGLACGTGVRVDVTLVFTGLHATWQELINGEWVATRLAGNLRRLAFAAPGCSGGEESVAMEIAIRR
jgi:hypothetical protein